MSRPCQSPIRIMRIIARTNIGGPAVQVSSLMRGFNSVEFDQRLYTGVCASNEADYLELVATDVKANLIEGLGQRIDVRGHIKAFIFLVREIRQFKPHVIHTHTAKAGLLGRIASIVSLQTSIRVHTFHGHLLNGYFGRVKKLLIVFVEKTLAYFTHELLAVGSKVRQDLLQSGIGSISNFGIMPPGVEIGRLPSKVESQESLGISVGTLQCAFIGRVTQIKRPDRFLDVVLEIKNRGIELDFYLAGDGELLEMCRKRIEKEDLPVVLLGWQNNIEKVLSAADMVLLTSDNEGMPVTLIQAGMAGLPVVTTNVGSVAEVVLDGITGIITELDVQAIADALEKLTTDSPLRIKLGNSAIKFTLENFGVKRLIHDHEILYKKLLSKEANFNYEN